MSDKSFEKAKRALEESGATKRPAAEGAKSPRKEQLANRV
jgi:hypothetical protein